MSSRSDHLRRLLSARVLVADGAMGTMLQAADPSMEDFQQLEGCNEILNVTRPDIVRSVHDAYLEVGCDMIETNTFGANLGNLGEYDIPERTYELAEAGARIAREAADAWACEQRPRFVLGSIGPGTKLPSLGHAPYAALRDAYEQCARGLVDGGADALLVETSQDLLQAKAAVAGCRRALTAAGEDLPIIAQVTIETTGSMLMGSEIGAALTVLVPLGIDAIGLNCATGPAEMSEHLRHLAHHSSVPISVMPNAGLPQIGKDGAHYPLTPDELAAAHEHFVADYGVSIVGGCCGTTPEHLARVVEAVGGRPVVAREVNDEPSVASLYTSVPFRQDASFLSIGERTNANGSKAFREAMLAGRWDDCLEIAKAQTREGAHLLDVCVDYVGRDGVGDMAELVGRLATSSTLPLVLDSTEPAVVEAGLERLGGRALINSVNYEDGDGPGSRFQRMVRLAQEHGAGLVALTIDEKGQARSADHKVAVATRLIEALTTQYGFRVEDIVVDCLTFPVATGQEETRRDAVETIEAIRAINALYPGVQTTLGVSNVSFGLKPAARVVLNSVFLGECVKAGLSSAIVNAAKILPTARIPQEQLAVALDLVHDRREWAGEPGASECTYDPLARMLELFEGVDSASLKASRAEELAALPLQERLRRRIIDGERQGLEADLDEALAGDTKALDIINDHLLEGMKVVGELFGSGKMQLPFVLQSAETMKTAVAYLEPTIEAQEAAAGHGRARQSKGTILLATVKGDVHDIGKNLVDIILSNNGYDTVNIGIKQTIGEIIDAATAGDVDALGMSGLLVKSTVVMKDNLLELNDRGLAQRWPVILGGAALTRAYVEQDLAELYDGHVRYARDAFEGLRLMDAIATAKNDPSRSLEDTLPELRKRRVRKVATANLEGADTTDTTRSDVAADNEIPTPPFWGSRIVKGIKLADIAAFLDERATFLGQWGLKPTRGGPTTGVGHERSEARTPQEARPTNTSGPTTGVGHERSEARTPQEARPTTTAPTTGVGHERSEARTPQEARPTTVPPTTGAGREVVEGRSYEDLVEAEGRPRLRMWLDRIATEEILRPAVVYGYFPCYSEGNDLVVLWHEAGPDGEEAGSQRWRFTFPRQRRDRRLCLADFFRSRQAYEADGRPDVIALQLVTMGERASAVTAELFAANAYRDYMELHGLSVQLTEALAEMWHHRVREELGFGDPDSLSVEDMLDVRFRGCRYSFGYPACPDLESRAGTIALLAPERIGVVLSEELQLHPEQSTDALIVHHPEAKYFKV